jgi:hypothetical protein
LAPFGGNVGIGTSDPQRHLQVVGAGDQEIGIQSSDSGGRLWTLQSSNGGANGSFQIIDRNANLSRLSILDNGNIGIGTTSPEQTLHVVDWSTSPVQVRDLAFATAAALLQTMIGFGTRLETWRAFVEPMILTPGICSLFRARELSSSSDSAQRAEFLCASTPVIRSLYAHQASATKITSTTFHQAST